MRLEAEDFGRLVRWAPLVALDLIVVNARGEVLLGRRANPPAQDWLFVPGGRLYKGESAAAGLARISSAEIGVELPREEARLLGVYDHLYPDNALGQPGFGTHYLIIACRWDLAADLPVRPDPQNHELSYVPIDTLAGRSDVHPYTRAYFEADPANRFLPWNGA